MPIVEGKQGWVMSVTVVSAHDNILQPNAVCFDIIASHGKCFYVYPVHQPGRHSKLHGPQLVYPLPYLLRNDCLVQQR